MVCIKFDFDLSGSLGKKENMKEYLIILDASDKIKYSRDFFFFKEKTNIFTTKFQSLSRCTNQGNLNKEHLVIPRLQQKHTVKGRKTIPIISCMTQMGKI